METVDVYPSLSRRGTAGCKHGKRKGKIATIFNTSIVRVGGSKGRRHLAVVWLYPVSESGVTGSITFKPQPPIAKRNAHVFLLSRECYSLLVCSNQRKQVECDFRHGGHIQQLDSQLPWENNSQRSVPYHVDQMVVTDYNLVIAQSYIAQSQLNGSCERMHHCPLSTSHRCNHYVPYDTSHRWYQACTSQDNTQSHRRCSGLAHLRLMSALVQAGCEPFTGTRCARFPSNENIFPSLCRTLRGGLCVGAWGILLLLP